MRRISTKHDEVELTLHLHAETERAVRVSDDGEDDNAVWLPKSQIEYDMVNSDTIEATLPEWLAEREGLT